MTVHRYTLELEPRRHQLRLTLVLDGVPPGALRLAVPTAENSGLRVSDVSDVSSAAEAGLAAGDELPAVEGRPYRLAVLRYFLERRREVSLRVRRGERSWNVVVPVLKHTEVTRLVWEGSAAQAEHIHRWLGADFQPQRGEAIPLSAYDNFHGIQRVL